MDSTDRHEVIIVEAERMAVVEARRGLPVPLDATSRFCVPKIFHRSEVSEGEVQGRAACRSRAHGLRYGLQTIWLLSVYTLPADNAVGNKMTGSATATCRSCTAHVAHSRLLSLCHLLH
jgi:hypothetical protein